ncbi:hypothetical protein N431DRAFT_489145 [Stipitochalara longipes BDJ]|nr:hypothetical protein N431DRAFT_489145 [Stipitochalara longipes BDJ]
MDTEEYKKQVNMVISVLMGPEHFGKHYTIPAGKTITIIAFSHVSLLNPPTNQTFTTTLKATNPSNSAVTIKILNPLLQELGTAKENGLNHNPVAHQGANFHFVVVGGSPASSSTSSSRSSSDSSRSSSDHADRPSSARPSAARLSSSHPSSSHTDRPSNAYPSAARPRPSNSRGSDLRFRDLA